MLLLYWKPLLFCKVKVGIFLKRLSNKALPPLFGLRGLKSLVGNPVFVVDGGHNPQCAETVANNLIHYFHNIPHILLIGILADKDISQHDPYFSTGSRCLCNHHATISRALPAQELAARLQPYGKPVIACDSIQKGVAKSIELAGTDGMVCSVGSLFTAGDVRACFGL